MRISLSALLVLLLAGCTDVSLFRAAGGGDGPLDNKLTVQSSFCTLDPNELMFPVKIMFIVDTSQSMNTTDPTGRRVTAVQDVIDAFLPDPGVEFAIISFNGATNVLTQDASGQDGFTRVVPDLQSAVVNLGMAGSTTDYEGALSNAFRVLSSDMQKTSEVNLSRSRYVLIFVSDGLPNPVVPPTNTRDAILDVVDDIMNLRRIYRPKEIELHTALVLSQATVQGFRCTDEQGGDPNCEAQRTAPACQMQGGCMWIGVQDEATNLLTTMARQGNGTFRSFPNGEEINFLRIDFTSIRRVFTLKNLVVTNESTRPFLVFASPADRVGRAVPDSDGDGIEDAREREIGSSLTDIDTDGDGFNDLLELRLGPSGFDPLDPSDADCSLAVDRVDTDGDGLLDCEERFVGTNRFFFDSDADGAGDTVELRANTNPVTNDAKADLDFDSARNADEIRGHSNPLENDAAERSSIAYRYEVQDLGLRADGRNCYDFRVENITLTETVTGENRIIVQVDQAPFDDPADHGSFRVACVKQTYYYPDFRDPPFPAVEFPPEAFREPTDFDPARDCVVGQLPAEEEEEETP